MARAFFFVLLKLSIIVGNTQLWVWKVQSVNIMEIDQTNF